MKKKRAKQPNRLVIKTRAMSTRLLATPAGYGATRSYYALIMGLLVGAFGLLGVADLVTGKYRHGLVFMFALTPIYLLFRWNFFRSYPESSALVWAFHFLVILAHASHGAKWRHTKPQKPSI